MTCHLEKQLSDFGKRKDAKKDGRRNECLICVSNRLSKWRKTENAKVANQKYFSSDKWKSAKEKYRKSDAYKAVVKRQEKRHYSKGQIQARWAVKHAIRTGKINKHPCRECGNLDRVHAHHEDYSKPLEVIWFCPGHHQARHKYLKSINWNFNYQTREKS